MFFAGFTILLLACALFLSSLQGWALRGSARLPRHLLAWVSGTALVSIVLVVTWSVAMAPRAVLAGASAFAHMPVPRPGVVLLLDAIVALGVAAALGAGAMHARVMHARMLRARHAGRHPRTVARGAWIGRAMVQGVALCAVGGIGAAALLLVAMAQLR